MKEALTLLELLLVAGDIKPEYQGTHDRGKSRIEPNEVVSFDPMQAALYELPERRGGVHRKASASGMCGNVYWLVNSRLIIMHIINNLQLQHEVNS